MLQQAALGWKSRCIITTCQVLPAAQGRPGEAVHTHAHARVEMPAL